MRGGGKTADIDTRRRTEIHPVGIGQKHLTVGSDTAMNLARLRIKHAIERDRLRTRLIEIDLRLTADIEGLPVDGCAIGSLIDIEPRASLRDAGLPRHHLAARGQLRGRGRARCLRARHASHGHRGRSGQQALGDAAHHAFAAPFGCFGRRHKCIVVPAPHQSIGAVH